MNSHITHQMIDVRRAELLAAAAENRRAAELNRPTLLSRLATRVPRLTRTGAHGAHGARVVAQAVAAPSGPVGTAPAIES
jgi:hypothetical protein